MWLIRVVTDSASNGKTKMDYKQTTNKYGIPVLISELSARKNKTTGEIFTPKRTHIDTRRFADYCFSKLQYDVFKNDTYTVSLNILGYKTEDDIKTKRYVPQNIKQKLYFNFNLKKFSGFGRAERASEYFCDKVDVIDCGKRTFSQRWWDETREMFEIIVDQNMITGSRGRTKRPEFYTAGLVQGRDFNSFSERAAALLIVKEYSLLVVMRIGEVVAIEEVANTHSGNLYANNVQIRVDDTYDIDNYEECGEKSNLDMAEKQISCVANVCEKTVFHTLQKAGLVDFALDFGLRKHLETKHNAEISTVELDEDYVYETLYEMIITLETFENKQLVKNLAKTNFWKSAVNEEFILCM